MYRTKGDNGKNKRKPLSSPIIIIIITQRCDCSVLIYYTTTNKYMHMKGLTVCADTFQNCVL